MIFEIEVPKSMFYDAVRRDKITLTEFYALTNGWNSKMFVRDIHSVFTTVIMENFSAVVKKIESQPMPCQFGNYGQTPVGGEPVNRLVIPGFKGKKTNFLFPEFLSMCTIPYVTLRVQYFM